MWRILKWKCNCDYIFIHKFFFRVGGEVYILVTLENKMLIFGILRCENKNYVAIICLRNMEKNCMLKEKKNKQNFTIRKHGRKLLHFSVLRIKAEFVSKSPWEKTTQDNTADCLGSVRIFTCSSLHLESFQFTKE